jgi:hypothetical protein
MPALPAMPPRLTALYGEDGGVVLLVGERSVLLRKQSLPYLNVMLATYSTISIPRSHLGKRAEGTHGLGLGQQMLGSGWHRMSIRTQLRMPVGSQDGVCVGALPLGVAPVTPLDGACLLLLELLSVFPRDLHCVVLGHGGLGVLRPLEESQL